MKQLTLKITTISPVILTAMSGSTIMTETRDYFSGPIIRGILAKEYIKAANLGKAAHQDSTFRQLFFDKLRFLPAYPAIADKRSFPLPLSLAKNKLDNSICDLLISDSRPAFKAINGFGLCYNELLAPVTVKKCIELHMSRSDVSAKQSEKQQNEIGKERLAGKSSKGGIYNYESISAGQTFFSSIIGEETELNQLKNAIPKSFIALAGRSKLTQYGECRITLTELSDIPGTTIPKSETICLRLDTPLIPSASFATSLEKIISDEILPILNDGNTTAAIQLATGPRRHFGKMTEIDNFVGVWSMKRPRSAAIEAGSVFTLVKPGGFNDSDCQKLRLLAEKGAGLRTEEGFGQIRLWQPQQLLKLAEKTGLQKPAPQKLLTAKASELALSIMNRRFLETLRALAAIDAHAATGLSKEKTHCFAKLDTILTAKQSCKAFSDELAGITKQESAGNNKPMTAHLSSVKLNNLTLKKLLFLPLSDAPQLKNREELTSLSETFKKLSSEITTTKDPLTLASDKAYNTYWQWFFRYARKNCQIQSAKEGDKK